VFLDRVLAAAAAAVVDDVRSRPCLRHQPWTGAHTQYERTLALARCTFQFLSFELTGRGGRNKHSNIQKAPAFRRAKARSRTPPAAFANGSRSEDSAATNAMRPPIGRFRPEPPRPRGRLSDRGRATSAHGLSFSVLARSPLNLNPPRPGVQTGSEFRNQPQAYITSNTAIAICKEEHARDFQTVLC
jgi:hypothetical protein